MSKHTPGPWYADDLGRIWRRDPNELYENGGGVAGDRAIAVASPGWIGKDVTGYPVRANASLIAAAPELLEALKGFTDYPEDMLNEFRENRSGVFTMTVPVALMAQALDAIAKAEGR